MIDYAGPQASQRTYPPRFQDAESSPVDFA